MTTLAGTRDPYCLLVLGRVTTVAGTFSIPLKNFLSKDTKYSLSSTARYRSYKRLGFSCSKFRQLKRNTIPNSVLQYCKYDTLRPEAEATYEVRSNEKTVLVVSPFKRYLQQIAGDASVFREFNPCMWHVTAFVVLYTSCMPIYSEDFPSQMSRRPHCKKK
jgi:hypothetical protein